MNISDAAKDEIHDHVDSIGLVQSHLSRELKDEEWMVIQKATNASDEFIALMMKEKNYTNAMNDWTAYQDWKSGRNEKRRVLEEKYGYDTKHAMHLVRLLRMAMEIMETGKVNVCRPDAEDLKAIRNGLWKYDTLEAYAEDCDLKLNELYKITTLPKQPDRVFVDQLCQRVIKDYVWG